MSDTPVKPALLDAYPLVAHWIALEDEGSVTVLTGRVELGQGNLTAISQIAAEELDLDPARVRLVSGDTVRTPNEGFTAGSLSISVGGQCVRLAASALRHLVLAEAASLLQRGPDELELRDGMVLAAGMETGLSLWSLRGAIPADAAVMATARPKAPGARRITGTSLPRIDLRDRIAGAPFVQDLVLDGMVHGRAIHPPGPHARLESLDLDALAARPGIRSVLRDGSFLGVIAAREEDAIAAAAWARDAARWSAVAMPEGHPVDIIAAADGVPDVVFAKGDAAAAPGTVHETMVTKPFITHGSIGPSCAVALWDAAGGLAVWTHSQGVFPLRDAMARVLGLDPAAIHVRHMFGAGCYGHNGADDVALDAALLARSMPGTPVRVVWSRADEFTIAPLQSGMATRIRATVDGGGQITGMRIVTNSAPHGNRPGVGGTPNLRAGFHLQDPIPVPRTPDLGLAMGGGADRNAIPLYDIPNLSVEKRIVHDLPFRTSSMRGLGAFLNVYAIETMMDDIAHDLGLDPLDFRLRHMADPRACAVIARAAEMAGWPRKGTETQGWGMGFARYKNTAAWCAVVAEVEVDEAVSLRRVWCAVDCGEVINPDGIVNQIEGGIIQSASWALKEAVAFDRDVVATRTWEDYPILRFDEVPLIEIAIIDRPDEPMVGCGEASQGPTAAAIGNAIRAAPGLDVRVRHLPLTRDAIISALV